MKVEIVNGMIHATSMHLETSRPGAGDHILSMESGTLIRMMNSVVQEAMCNPMQITPMMMSVILAIYNKWYFEIKTSRDGIVAPSEGYRGALGMYRDKKNFGKQTKLKEIGKNWITLDIDDVSYIIDSESIQEIVIYDQPLEAMRTLTITFKKEMDHGFSSEVIPGVSVCLISRSFKKVAKLLKYAYVSDDIKNIEVETEPAKLMENVYLVDNPFKLATLIDGESIPCSLVRKTDEDLDTVFKYMRNGTPYIASVSPMIIHGGKHKVQYEISLLSLPEFQAEVKSVTPKQP